jgi:16S rRNA (cytidine1402-2'-O)-methyltransferase
MPTIGSLYMIPVPVAENAIHTLSPDVAKHSSRIKYFFVENIREARRFLKAMDKTINIDELTFCETNRNTVIDIKQLVKWLHAGFDVAVLSDAGCPGVADPGANLALEAQKIGARVIPLVGPSSILLSLMASGLNGQSFCFNGYLPVQTPTRSARIKELEAISVKLNQTQLFIETPYRNNHLLHDLVKNCNPKTLLCIALDITGANEMVVTKSIEDWVKQKIVLPKLPAIFLLLG